MHYFISLLGVLILVTGCASQTAQREETAPAYASETAKDDTGRGDIGPSAGAPRLPLPSAPEPTGARGLRGNTPPMPRRVVSTSSIRRLKLPIPALVPVDGPKGAPVTIVVFFDFQCHWCKRAQKVLTAVRKRFKSRVRVAYFNFPLPRHVNAAVAAMAGIEAGLQKKFPAMRDKIFAGAASISEGMLLKWAGEVGMDTGRLKRVLDSKAHLSTVKQQMLAARGIGVRGTPTILVNGRKYNLSRDEKVSQKRMNTLVTEELAIIKRRGIRAENAYRVLTKNGVKSLARLKGRRVAKRVRPRTRKVVDPTKVYRVLRDFSSEMQRGASSPLVTMVAFIDYQCPYCGRWNKTVQKLLKAYPKTLRVIYMHNPLRFHKSGVPAAMAAMEVYHQKGNSKGFRRFHDTLFANRKNLTTDNLVKWAVRDAGASGPKVRAAIEERRHLKRLRAGMSWGAGLGVRGVPAFFVNGYFKSGARPYTAIKGYVEEAKKRAKRAIRSGLTTRARVYKHLVGKGLKKAVYITQKIPERKRRKRPRLDTTRRYRVEIKGRPFIGDPNGTAVMAVALDLQCPYSSRLLKILFALLEGAPKRSDLSYDGHSGFKKGLKIVFLHYPLPFHSHAQLAQEALQEVFRQKGRRGTLKFLKLVAPSFRQLPRATLEGFAKKVGCNMRRFRRALDKRLHRETVRSAMTHARTVGVMGTPSVYLNGKYIRGRSVALYSALIKKAMAEAKRYLRSHRRVRRKHYYKALMKGAEPKAIWIKPKK